MSIFATFTNQKAHEVGNPLIDEHLFQGFRLIKSCIHSVLMLWERIGKSADFSERFQHIDHNFEIVVSKAHPSSERKSSRVETCDDCNNKCEKSDHIGRNREGTVVSHECGREERQWKQRRKRKPGEVLLRRLKSQCLVNIC